jgi:hypothetical protein
LRALEPRVFTARDEGKGPWKTFYGDWQDVGQAWINEENTTNQYKQEYPQSKADLSLEIYNSYVVLKEDKLYLKVMVKLFNTTTRHKIALGYSDDSFQMSAIKDKNDFTIFENEFRHAINQSCDKVLGEIGLINIP